MSESLVACVVDGENGVEVVRRAVELARAQKASLQVLVFDSRGEDYVNEHELDLRFAAEAVAPLGGNIQSVHTDSATESVEALRALAERVQATQIIIGDDKEGALNRLLGWTTANLVMHYVPGVDLHIVGVKESTPTDNAYEPAIRASLTELDDGRRRLELDPGRNDPIGLFFREIDTDFDHGYFMYESQGGEQIVPIVDGMAEN